MMFRQNPEEAFDHKNTISNLRPESSWCPCIWLKLIQNGVFWKPSQIPKRNKSFERDVWTPRKVLNGDSHAKGYKLIC